MRRIWIFLLALALAAPAFAATDVSSVLQEVVDKYHVPGMAAAVTTRKDIIGLGCAGVRRLDPDGTTGGPAKIAIDDQFHLGSDTKAMTATLCALYVEEGKLKWDTTLGEVFPELVPKMQPGWADVTLLELLTHRSGAPANPDMNKIAVWRQYDPPLLRPEGRMLLFSEVVQQPLAHQPGEAFEYSNVGYTIVGAMLERVTGKTWERLMEERLFLPLGMESAGFGPPRASRKSPGKAGMQSTRNLSPSLLTESQRDPTPQAMGHSAEGEPAGYGPAADNPQIIGPAGTVHASVTDWAAFARMHLDAGRSYPRMLNAVTFDALHSVPDAAKGADQPQYACGWAVTKADWTNGLALYHQGSNTLWVAQIWVAPKRDVAIVVATNQGGDNAAKACSEAVEKIAALILDE